MLSSSSFACDCAEFLIVVLLYLAESNSNQKSATIGEMIGRQTLEMIGLGALKSPPQFSLKILQIKTSANDHFAKFC